MAISPERRPLLRDGRHAWLPIGLALMSTVTILALLLLDRQGACPWAALCGPLLAEDHSQTRLDAAVPAPQGALVVEQSFTPHRNGLTEIELLLLRYETPASADAHFDVELWDETGALVAAATLSVASLTHNQPYTLSFAPQPASAGCVYTLRLRGSDDNPISAWGYSLDVYSGGQLALATEAPAAPPATTARDLRFVTRYALTAGDALAAAVAPLRRDGLLLLVAALLLPLPGVLLLLLVRPRAWDGAAWAGAALALGVAAWPLLWLWPSLVGWRWSAATLWAALALGWLAVALIVIRRRTTDHRPQITANEPLVTDHRPLATRHLPPATRHSPLTTDHCLLITILLASLALRFIAVRDLAFPPWVDSSRHALITAVMVESGRAPDGYAPYLPVQGFPYHFGFHTLPAGLALLTGRPLPGLLLTLGQLLNGLLPLSVYAAAWLVTRRRGVAVLAAFLVALPFFFPGYYATWGRMTQLTAMVIMPVLLALTWRLGRGRPGLWPLVSVLAAGLFLVHFRVFLFYAPFAALAFIVHAFGRRPWPLLDAGLVALLLVAPRLARLLADTDPLATIAQSQPGYNAFPTGYVMTGWERLYLALAAIAALLVLIGALRRRRWASFPLLLLGWVGVLFVLLAGERLGLPETLVVNLNSMYITLFLPLALLLSIVAGRVWRLASGGWRVAVVRGLSAVVCGLSLGLLVLFGARQQANILNQATILARPEDAPALDWMAANLPAGAYVAVNAWPWLGATWAGSDGGAWIVPLTGRATTTPPVDHIYNPALFAQVRTFNETAATFSDWGDPAVAGWLRVQGVTHVYTGQRGGPFDPAELSRNPQLALLFQHEGAFVFGVR